MSELEKIIRDLIDLKKEGDYWDFKMKHHDKAGNLIKDIMCLANTPKHKGDRYIIFGVADDYSIPGISPGTGKTQTNIIDTLAKAGFDGNNYPDVSLKELSIDGACIQVLLIKDLPEKPYYLQTAYNKKGVRLNPGTIYSRVRDSNTSSDRVASAADIELMWRERHGLDCTPLKRLRKFLLNFDGWTETSEISDNSWYYSEFPEFTISETDDERWEVAGGESWVRVAPNPLAFVRPMKLSYHQTVLAVVTCIDCDNGRRLIPAPKRNLDPVNHDLWFFSIVAGSLDFLYLQFLLRLDEASLLRQGLSRSTYPHVPVILFSSSEEQERFTEELRTTPVIVEDRHAWSRFPGDERTSEQDCEIVTYSHAVIERFNTWKCRTSRFRAPGISG